jgi:hypothetical protein
VPSVSSKEQEDGSGKGAVRKKRLSRHRKRLRGLSPGPECSLRAAVVERCFIAHVVDRSPVEGS